MSAAFLKAPPRPSEKMNGCWKQAFENAADATKQAVAGGIAAHPYKCHICGKWHLSSKTLAEYRRVVAMAKGQR